MKDVTGETEAVKQKVTEAVKDITGEMEAVRSDVRRATGQLREVASDVHEIKEEIKTKEEHSQHERPSLR